MIFFNSHIRNDRSSEYRVRAQSFVDDIRHGLNLPDFSDALPLNRILSITEYFTGDRWLKAEDAELYRYHLELSSEDTPSQQPIMIEKGIILHKRLLTIGYHRSPGGCAARYKKLGLYHIYPEDRNPGWTDVADAVLKKSFNRVKAEKKWLDAVRQIREDLLAAGFDFSPAQIQIRRRRLLLCLDAHVDWEVEEDFIVKKVAAQCDSDPKLRNRSWKATAEALFAAGYLRSEDACGTRRSALGVTKKATKYSKEEDDIIQAVIDEQDGATRTEQAKEARVRLAEAGYERPSWETVAARIAKLERNQPEQRGGFKSSRVYALLSASIITPDMPIGSILSASGMTKYLHYGVNREASAESITIYKAILRELYKDLVQNLSAPSTRPLPFTALAEKA